MWEKIAKEMACPWRVAEAMHWQLGEEAMAQRANVTVFHLAGHGPPSALYDQEAERGVSISPPAGVGMSYIHTHNHSMPQNLMPRSHPVSPIQTRVERSSSSSSPAGPQQYRNRADSVRSNATVSSGGRMQLAPMVGSQPPVRYVLPPPPMVMGHDMYRR